MSCRSGPSSTNWSAVAKAHILVAFLGYALSVTLKHLLTEKGSAASPAKALGLLGTLVSADIVLPTTTAVRSAYGASPR